MNTESKILAEAVFRTVIVGRNICGIHFYGNVPVLLIDNPKWPDSNPTAYLTLESHWQVFDQLPNMSVDVKEDMLEHPYPVEELAKVAAMLRTHTIDDAQVESNVPHLIIRFDDGHVLFVNGHHEKFECWQLDAGEFGVVAAPGDDLSVWMPENFVTTK